MSTLGFRPAFGEGAVVAFLFALVGAALVHGAAGIGAPLSLRVCVVALSGAYALYLLSRAPSAVGRWVTPVVWVLLLALTWSVSLGVFVFAQAAFLWLVRTVYFHDGLIAATADAGLWALGFCFALWAAGTGSVFLAVWAFFLVQALFVWVPARVPGRVPGRVRGRVATGVPDAGARAAPADETIRFAEAQRNADAALTRLAAE